MRGRGLFPQYPVTPLDGRFTRWGIIPAAPVGPSERRVGNRAGTHQEAGTKPSRRD